MYAHTHTHTGGGGSRGCHGHFTIFKELSLGKERHLCVCVVFKGLHQDKHGGNYCMQISIKGRISKVLASLALYLWKY